MPWIKTDITLITWHDVYIHVLYVLFWNSFQFGHCDPDTSLLQSPTLTNELALTLETKSFIYKSSVFFCLLKICLDRNEFSL